MTPTKPFYLSTTIVSAVIGTIVSFLNMFHINLSDLVPQITDAVGQTVNATVAVAAVVGAIYGRFRAHKSQVTLGPSSPKKAGLFLLALAPLAAAVTLVACSTAPSTYTYTPAGSATPVTITGFGAWCENNLTTITNATKTTATIGANFLIKQGSTRARIAAYITAIVTPLQKLLAGGSISSTDIDKVSTSLDQNDGAWGQIASPILTLLSGYLVQLENEGAPSKVTFDVVNAVLSGLQSVAQEYAPATTTTTTTTAQPILTGTVSL